MIMDMKDATILSNLYPARHVTFLHMSLPFARLPYNRATLSRASSRNHIIGNEIALLYYRMYK